MVFNKGLRIGGNIQDFSLGQDYRDSCGVFAQKYLGWVRWPIHFEDIFANPSSPDWSVWFCDRAVDWSIEWGVPILFMLEAVPTDNVHWRTLAGHAGTALLNRNGDPLPADNRFVRPEAALYPTIISCIETVLDRIADRYIANDKDPSEWMAVQWWNEPWINDGNEPLEFNIMSFNIVPSLKAKCTELGIELWSPPIGGGQGPELSFEAAVTQELGRISGVTNPIFEVFDNGEGEVDPVHWQYYDALTIHSPYLGAHLYRSKSATDLARWSADKCRQVIAASKTKLTQLGYDFSTAPVYATEGGFGYYYMGVGLQGRLMNDAARGRLIRMQAEHCLNYLDGYCIYLIGNSEASLDYPGTNDQAQYGLIRNDGTWTKACVEIASAAGYDISLPDALSTDPDNWAEDDFGTDLPAAFS